MKNRILCLLALIILPSLPGFLGCSNKIHALVPEEAKLIWSGIIDNPYDLKNIHWETAGQIYLVEEGSRIVKETRTIWPENTDFTFSVTPGRTYQIYFLDDPTYQPKENGDGPEQTQTDQPQP